MLRILFFALLVRPAILLLLGLNVRQREHLPVDGPAILIGNHNSHLDTLVMMALLPLRLLPRVHPVAAADYFLRNRVLAWFALNVIGIIPLARRPIAGSDPLAPCVSALARKEILIFFPEGTRGVPEQLSQFKSGVAHLAERSPDVDVIPIFMHGLGKALPKGEAILVPFFCDVFVGPPLRWSGQRSGYMQELQRAMDALARQGHFPEWL